MSKVIKNEASYIVFTDGTYYYARNGNTGKIDYGGSGNEGEATGTSLSSVINSAISGLPSEGGTVFVKAGSYTLDDTITINDFGVVLEGEGIGTKITLDDDKNCNMIDMTGSGKNFQIVRNLYLHGNKDNNSSGHGIYMNHDYGGGSDSHARVELCWIRETAQDGIRIANPSGESPADTREAQLDTVTITRAGRHAFYIAGSDNKIYGCIAEQPAQVGFYLSTAQHHVDLCKSFGAGWGNQDYPGFALYTKRGKLTNCEAQDNYGHGFDFYSAEDCVLAGCTADSNGIQGSQSGFALRGSSKNNELKSCNAYNRSGKSTQNYGLQIGSSATDNICHVLCHSNTTQQIDIDNADNIISGWEDGWTYQTQTGSWADPSGNVYNGRKVTVYNSTQAGYRLYSYANSGWHYSTCDA